MAEMTQNDFNKLLNEIFVNGISLSLRGTKEDENEAKRNATKYIKTKKLNSKTPRTMYYIISELNENERMDFIRRNIEYIRENDEEIFIY